MAAQALIAVFAEPRLSGEVGLGIAAVCRVVLGSQLLVPEPAIQAGMRRVTVCSGVGPGAFDRGIAARPQIVHSHNVP